MLCVDVLFHILCTIENYFKKLIHQTNVIEQWGICVDYRSIKWLYFLAISFSQPETDRFPILKIGFVELNKNYLRLIKSISKLNFSISNEK